MPRFMIIHHYIGDPEKAHESMSSPDLINALVKANGNTVPGRCIYSWLPYNYGRKDLYGFCLWEANSVKDVELSLEGVKQFITADIMQVDEVVWAALAEAAAVH